MAALAEHPEDVVLADWNAEVPEDSPFLVKAWIDNNSALGVAVDLNQERPLGAPEKPVEIPPEELEAPDPESDWFGDRRSGDGTNLPHSVYASPDLTFVDPPDHDAGYGDYAAIGDGLAAQVAVPE